MRNTGSCLLVPQIRVFIIRGNHDALSRITKELTLPDSVKVFGGRAEAVTLDRPAGDFPIAVHGLSFAQPHAPQSLLPRYKAPVEGAVNVALMHTSLAGAPVTTCTLPAASPTSRSQASVTGHLATSTSARSFRGIARS